MNLGHLKKKNLKLYYMFIETYMVRIWKCIQIVTPANLVFTLLIHKLCLVRYKVLGVHFNFTFSPSHWLIEIEKSLRHIVVIYFFFMIWFCQHYHFKSFIYLYNFLTFWHKILDISLNVCIIFRQMQSMH